MCGVHPICMRVQLCIKLDIQLEILIKFILIDITHKVTLVDVVHPADGFRLMWRGLMLWLGHLVSSAGGNIGLRVVQMWRDLLMIPQGALLCLRDLSSIHGAWIVLLEVDGIGSVIGIGHHMAFFLGR